MNQELPFDGLTVALVFQRLGCHHGGVTQIERRHDKGSVDGTPFSALLPPRTTLAAGPRTPDTGRTISMSIDFLQERSAGPEKETRRTDLGDGRPDASPDAGRRRVSDTPLPRAAASRDRRGMNTQHVEVEGAGPRPVASDPRRRSGSSLARSMRWRPPAAPRAASSPSV
jgi:hypothetical protein